MESFLHECLKITCCFHETLHYTDFLIYLSYKNIFLKGFCNASFHKNSVETVILLNKICLDRIFLKTKETSMYLC